jgi:hypothetical protein
MMEDFPLYVRGSELKVGDTIEVWWSMKRDTITALKPYKGPLEYLWPEGARSAKFAVSTLGMTIEPHAAFTVVARR